MDLYQVVTDKILAQLESGVAPWIKPWGETSGGLPYNAISGKAYRGINTMMLFAPAGAVGNAWLTYKQAQDVGAQVRKGEKGSMIVFFKPWKVTDKNAKPGEVSSADRTIPVLRYFTVFHTSQIDNLPEKYLPVPPLRLPECERIAAAEKIMAQASVNHGGDRAYYRSGNDTIQLPQMAQFSDVESYYATALHELTHWTGNTESALAIPHTLAKNWSRRWAPHLYALISASTENSNTPSASATGSKC